MSDRLSRIIEAVCTGTARPFNGAELSAIAKTARHDRVQILPHGLAPDEQADAKHHGGPEMALHLYPLDHHAFWRDQIGAHELLDQPGAFGSNIAVAGITEHDVHIGDRFRLGSAIVEISQPRKPCWKIEHRFGQKGMVAQIIQTARCGWYFRVIETGEVAAGDHFERILAGQTDWSVARVFTAIYAGKATAEELGELATLAGLAPEIQQLAAAKQAS